MKGLLAAGLLALTAVVYAGPVPHSGHVMHEKREALHPRWTKRSRVHPASILPVRIGLTQSNLEDAHLQLFDVSDPESPNFAKHWSAEKVVEYFKPSDEVVDAVQGWLIKAGIARQRITHSDNKVWLAFDATTEEMERLLQTEFFEYEDKHSGGLLPSCDEYHVPEHIREHIDYITPGVRLLAPSAGEIKHIQRQRQKRGEVVPRLPHDQSLHKLVPPPPGFNISAHRFDLSTCDIVITPACVAALYKIPENKDSGRRPRPDNVLGIYESLAEYYYQGDLDLFYANFTPYIHQGVHPRVFSIDGAPGPTTDPAASGTEVMLDLQLAYPIVYPQSIGIWQEDDANYEVNSTYLGGFNHLLDAIDGSYCKYTAFGLSGDNPYDPVYPDPAPGGYKGKLQCGVYKPTNVISVSYGWQEVYLPYAYQRRQCNEFLKLGLQGVSFLFSSGDSGVAESDGPDGCLGPKQDIFNPGWPINCPWVTAVGATKVYPGHSVFERQPESAVVDTPGNPYKSSFSSGGGFSNIYPIPDYQKSAVSEYFKHHSPPYPYYSAIITDLDIVGDLGNGSFGANSVGGVYNRAGRGYPDVAANGDNIATFVGEVFQLHGGTSASCPIFAGILNRINEERLNVGKRPVGFINPTVYKHPEVFNDVVNGTNPGCGTVGFSAVKGWDPVTGLGTPIYPKLLDLFLRLP